MSFRGQGNVVDGKFHALFHLKHLVLLQYYEEKNIKSTKASIFETKCLQVFYL